MKVCTSARVDLLILERQTRACSCDNDMLTPTVYPPPPPHSSRHGPQHTQHTASTAATPWCPQGRRQTPADAPTPTQTVYDVDMPSPSDLRLMHTNQCNLPESGGHFRATQGGVGAHDPGRGIRGAKTKIHVFYSRLSLFCEYIALEHVRIHIIYRVNQAECGIRFLVVAPREYVNIYSPPSIIVKCGGVVLRVVGCGGVLVVSCVVLLWCCSGRVVCCIVLLVCLCV